MKRTHYLLLVMMTLLLSATLYSCGEDPEDQEKKPENPVEDWNNEDIDGDASLNSRMTFDLGDTLLVEGKMTSRATYTEVAGMEKCLLDENDIVTVEVSAGSSGSTRSTDKKNYKVGSNHISLTYYEGTPSLNEFHWENGSEKINIRAWSYGGTVADNTVPITDPDGQVFSVEQDQKANGYKELLYSPQQSDISFSTGKSGISLPLYHQLARVVVTLSKKASDDAATVSRVTIGDGTASIPVSGKFTKPSSGNLGTWSDFIWTAAKTIKMKEDDAANGIYSAVAIPTTYPKDMKFIYVTMSDGNKYAYTIDNADGLTLEAGKQYSFNISIGDDVATLQATYPTEWTSAGFPITTYDTSKSFGVYVYNGSTPVYSNIEMTAKAAGSTVELDAGSYRPHLSTSYTYYIYYPYTASPGTVVAGAASAEAFFTGLLSSWTPSTSQGNEASLRSSDLQMGMISSTASDNRKNQTRTVTMAHKMGGVKLVLETSRNVYSSLSQANSSTSTISNTFSGSATIGNSKNFSAYFPFESKTVSKTITRIDNTSSSAIDTYYYYILKPGNSVSFSAPYESGKLGWSRTTSNAISGAIQTQSVSCDRDFKDYTGTFTFVGSNCLSSSPLTWTIPGTGNYTVELWGAEGGARLASATVYGGRGGYVKASKVLTKSTSAYLYIGGSAILNSEAGTGGWNGGGNAGSEGWSGGGGGGTDIRIGGTGNGYNGATDNRVLVAGGGGGASGGNEDRDFLDGGYTNSGGSGQKFQGATPPSASDGGGGGGGYIGGNYGIDGKQIARGGTNYVGDGWTSIQSGRQTTVYENGKIYVSSSL